MEDKQQDSANEIDLPIEATNITATNLYNINEYCRQAIFSLLDVVDCSSLAATCKRFQHSVFNILPKKVQICYLGIGGFTIQSRVCKKIDDIERILKTFAPFFSDVSIVGYERLVIGKFTILDLVATHFKEIDDLQSLRMESIEIPDFLTIKMKPILKRLQKLHLYQVKIMANAKLFAELDSLVELSVENVVLCEAILINYFPKLERFTYRKRQVVMSDFTLDPVNVQTVDTLSIFISLHTTLKSLELSYLCDGNCTPIIMEVIGNNCKKLEDLRIQIEKLRVATLEPLQTLESLRILKIRKASLEDLTIFSGLPQLRELSLVSCDLPKDINQFANLKELLKLEMRESRCCRFDVAGIIELLVNLEELIISEFWFTFFCKEEIFSKTVTISDGRPNTLTMTCDFNFELYRSRVKGGKLVYRFLK